MATDLDPLTADVNEYAGRRRTDGAECKGCCNMKEKKPLWFKQGSAPQTLQRFEQIPADRADWKRKVIRRERRGRNGFGGEQSSEDPAVSDHDGAASVASGGTVASDLRGRTAHRGKRCRSKSRNRKEAIAKCDRKFMLAQKNVGVHWPTWQLKAHQEKGTVPNDVKFTKCAEVQGEKGTSFGQCVRVSDFL